MIYCYNERYNKQYCKFSSVLYSDLAHAHHHLLLKHTTNINIREHIQHFLLFLLFVWLPFLFKYEHEFYTHHFYHCSLVFIVVNKFFIQKTVLFY